MNNYEQILSHILGKEKYKQLCQLTFMKIEEKFEEINIVSASKIAYTNHLAIFIIGILKSKNIEKDKIIKSLEQKDELINPYLIEENLDKFIQIYSEYIEMVKKYNEEKGIY